MFPKLITIGDFFLPAYGFFVALGFLAGVWLTSREARRAGLAPERIVDLAVYCSLAGLAGAKLLMFVQDFDYYSANPGRIFSFDTLLSAGIFHGGFLAALAFAWFYLRRHAMDWLSTADIFAPGVALGHAIGRLGCFAAGCCWGARCDLPWAVTFTNPDAHEMFGTPLGVKLHPAQLYESALTALVFLACWWVARRPHGRGAVLGAYLALYSAARIAVEFTRAHAQPMPFGGPFTMTQWIAIALFAYGALLVWRARRSRLIS